MDSKTASPLAMSLPNSAGKKNRTKKPKNPAVVRTNSRSAFIASSRLRVGALGVFQAQRSREAPCHNESNLGNGMMSRHIESRFAPAHVTLVFKGRSYQRQSYEGIVFDSMPSAGITSIVRAIVRR